jgi:hypothetical protein
MKMFIIVCSLFTSISFVAQNTYKLNDNDVTTGFTELQTTSDSATLYEKNLNMLILEESEIYSLTINNDSNDWGAWGNDDCFSGIDYRVKKGDYNNYAKQWYWYVQFRNRYNKQVHFSYAVAEPGTRPEPDHRTSVDANDVSDSTGFLLYSGGQIRVRVGYIRFGSYDSGAYSTCDK